MGIRGLENYIWKHQQGNIAKPINIRDQITEWKQDHDGSNPTIIINLKDFVKVLGQIDDDSLITGGKYDMYNNKFEKFSRELKEICGANLVFFCRPFLHDMEEDVILEAYDRVEQKNLKAFQNHLMIKERRTSPWHLDKRVLYNFVQISAKYGKVYTEHTKNSQKLMKYALDHPDEVLAMIQHDNDFLLYDHIQYQYWSLADLNISQLTTKKYCRKTMYKELRLSTPQSHLLAAIMKLKGSHPDVILKLCNKIECDEKPKPLFRLAKYVRGKTFGPHGFDLNEIATEIFGAGYTEGDKALIQDELSRYDLNLEDERLESNQISDEIVEFCKKNLYFAYGLIVEDITTNQSLAYIDLRRRESTRYVNMVVTVLLKLCGILFKDGQVEERPKTRQIKIKRNIADDAVPVEENIIYPSMDLPTLENMIIQEHDDSFSESRWSLFQWLLGLDADTESISNIKRSFNDKYIRIVLFTLDFLLKHNLIASREAAIILLSERNRQSKRGNGNVPSAVANWRSPSHFEGSWIQTAHKYTITFELICHCLEICGLRGETDLIQFDASEFHMIMRQPHQNYERINSIVGQLKEVNLHLNGN